MIFTPYDYPESPENFDLNTFYKMYDKVKKAHANGDSQLIFAKAPVISDFPKDEGISFIIEEIIALKNFTTQEVSNVLSKYISFIEKYKIELIKEFDNKCSSAYDGKLPNPKIDKLKVQLYFGYDRFHIINSDTLSRNKNGFYIEPIDYSFALDSNVASNFKKYDEVQDEQYKALYELLCSDKYNIDLLPYIIEIIMNGVKKYGINYKLNKNNKNEDQQKFFDNIKVFHKHNFFKEKSEKKFINSLIKAHNPLVKHIAFMYYSAYILVIIMMEAKFKFKDSQKKIKYYVFTELRKLGIPIENRYKAILYLFVKNPGHLFFKKIINIANTQKYFGNLDNTARDIALSNLDKYIYLNQQNEVKGIFPLLASDDEDFIQMLKDTKPDFILKNNGLVMYIYKSISKDIEKNYSNLFISKNSKVYHFEEQDLQELIQISKDKEQFFKNLIVNNN